MVNRRNSIKIFMIIILVVVLFSAVFLLIQFNFPNAEKKDKIITRSTTSEVAVIAIHGGEMEPGTSELADEIAGSNYNFYTYYGNSVAKHITATLYNEPIGRNLVESSMRTLSIHGCDGVDKFTYVGGLDKGLAEKVKKNLVAAGFTIKTAPKNLDASDPINIVNSNGSGQGVQIELSRGLRESFYEDLTESGRQNKTEAFYQYVAAIKAALVE